MEVHHHPHVAKKKFKEYLGEGFMIFIAVFLGFVAENIRESIGDSQKEKEYVASFIQNLKDDTLHLVSVIKENQNKIEGLEKLMAFSNADLLNPQTVKKFYKACGSCISYYSLFKSNDATMQQLKNSGALHYIKKDHVADSIAKYDIEVNNIYEAATLYNQATDNGIAASNEILNYSVYYDTAYYKNKSFTGKDLPPLLVDPFKQRLFFNKIVFEIGATRNYLNNLSERQPFMFSLLKYLKKEYHLENE